MQEINFNAIIIEASAGTGKTHWITEEFIKLLGEENPASDIRKILAVTFSEKASIEMKTRILEKIYKEIFPKLSDHKKVELENAILKIRISTIHSLCRWLLKRFAFYKGIDPFFTVIDKRESRIFFYRAFNRFLGDKNSDTIIPLLNRFKLQFFEKIVFSIIEKHPYTTIGTPKGELTEQITSITRYLSEIVEKMKQELSVLDFNDLEIMTHNILSETPEALMILEDFDEKNNFIFVDEFQDTNLIQWRIIYKLVEEWLSGYGAKAEAGKPYGIFLVGDRKQSIYKFRGAEGNVFDEAKKVLNIYCAERKLLKNYRSAPEIIEFINDVFQDTYPWTEEKLSLGLEVKVPSCIEINLIDEKYNENAKDKEYEWVLGKVFELIDSKKQVWDKRIKGFRPIEFKDIGILLRKKAGKKFPVLERHLKEKGIPFVVPGGIGFYQEQEIIFLLSLVLSILDPSDMYSLWNLSSSVYHINPDRVYQWRDIIKKKELVEVIEEVLSELNFWDGLSTQQKANVEKFLIIIEEWQGSPLYTISRNLRTMMLSDEEPKADIFSEHQNAVRVMTVHNAKGLEFPAVFLINIEDGKVNITEEKIFYRKTEGETPYKFILKKEADEEYGNEFKKILEEEEKRILYVALTRACQYLFISGIKKDSIWIKMLENFQSRFPATTVCKKSIVEEKTESVKYNKKYLFKNLRFAGILTSYTEEKKEGLYHYEKTILGDIAHKLMYDISEGIIQDKDTYIKRAKFYMKKVNFEKNKRMADILRNIYETIERIPELKKISEKREDGLSEVPFIIEVENKIYTGFIDRIIIREDVCYIYDYKMEDYKVERFKEQMDIYEKAVKKMFPDKDKVKRYIVFLKSGIIKEI
ncbi:MAG: UvrD-helicase domain-containing protein [Candidatus Omnitrophica bacterium]|nr:UvrD-helicase domain-containing protein [Candidatus Omnitrophota bacterium]